MVNRNHLIVAIDDDVENANIVDAAIRGRGYDIICFDDGAKAWDFLVEKYKEISVIVLAKTLPNISGMELLGKIQGHKHLKNIPVIIQTVDSGVGKYKNAIELGAQFYLEKPIDEKKLLRLVKASIRSQSRLSITDGFAEKVGKSSYTSCF